MSERPASIRWFGAVYLLWMVAAIGAETWFVFSQASGRSALDAPPGVVLFSGLTVAVHLGANLALRYFIVVRPRRVARTIFTTALVVGWAFFLFQLGLQMRARHFVPVNWRMALLITNLATQLGLMWLLFRPDASAWLRGEIADAPETLEETFR